MRWFYAIPAVLFFGLVAIFVASLVRSAHTPPDMLPSALIGKEAPQLNLPALDANAGASALHGTHQEAQTFKTVT